MKRLKRKAFNLICGIKQETQKMNQNSRYISCYRCKTLEMIETLSFYNQIDSKELDNLKYLHEKNILSFRNKSYFNLEEVIETLKKYKKQNKIIIELAFSYENEGKKELNNYLMNHKIDYENIYVYVDTMNYKLEDYIKHEKYLHSLIEGIDHFSPLEKYVYAYNIVKTFKQYKENSEDKLSARNLYDILDNDYMVCVGYSALLIDLLYKLGINCVEQSVRVEICQNKIRSEEKYCPTAWHSRVYTYLKDEKYGIDGFYFSDPTFDNNLKYDLYSHMLMTDLEVSLKRNYLKIYIYDSTELFNIESLEDFYEKIGFLLSRKSGEIDLTDIIRRIFFIIEKLDSTYYNYLKQKYNIINFNELPDDYDNLIEELGKYIVEKVNNPVSGETIMSAAYFCYKNGYYVPEKELEESFLEMVEYNKRNQAITFPLMVATRNDESEFVVMNEKNKFDIDAKKLIKQKERLR